MSLEEVCIWIIIVIGGYIILGWLFKVVLFTAIFLWGMGYPEKAAALSVVIEAWKRRGWDKLS